MFLAINYYCYIIYIILTLLAQRSESMNSLSIRQNNDKLCCFPYSCHYNMDARYSLSLYHREQMLLNTINTKAPKI